MWLIALHLVGVSLLQSTWMSVQFLLPVLAKKQFGANDWQVLAITAPSTIFFVFSIFWNDVFSRVSFRRYLIVYWLVACAPMLAIGGVTNYWPLLACWLISCVGSAGYHPVAGELLKTLYPDRVRGRVYGWLWGGSLVVTAVASRGIGAILAHDPASYHWFFPAMSVLQLLGIGVLLWLSHATAHAAVRAGRREGDRAVRNERALGVTGSESWGTRLEQLLSPIVHMGRILKADPVFARYEAAYMTYGVGWMIGWALLPLLATKKLGLGYDEYAEATTVAYLVAMVVMIVPCGLMMDRLGAVLTTGIAFALLTIYPMGLIFTTSLTDLTIWSAAYGVAHVGASMGWMLGPVALAPTPEKVPQYVAIHATLVGLRGAVFQFLGVLLYRITGSFTLPLALAAAAYVWSSVQMWRLHVMMKRA